jgi:hypothetical protein
MPYKWSPPISMYVDPKRAAAAELLTKRYEQNFAADSLLDQQLSKMAVSPLPNDQRIAKELRAQFGESLNDRAGRGDYHNMSRQVLLDANQFVKSYEPLKKNYEAYTGYQQGLAEQVEKGVITQDIANNSLAYSRYGNNGLKLDSAGGLDTNSYFKGYSPSKYVNILEKQFDIADKIAKEKTGGRGTVQQSMMGNALYDIIVDGQIVEQITEAQIRAAVGPLQNDPEVAAYLNQEALFRMYNKDDATIKGIIAQYADQLRNQASTYKSAEMQAMYNDSAKELDNVIRSGEDVRGAYASIIKDSLFDEALRSTVNTFATRSAYGGGVKSAKINKLWLEGHKARAAGFDVTTNLKEREPMTPSLLNTEIEFLTAQQEDNIEFLKEVSNYDGEITPEMVMTNNYPEQVANYLASNPTVKTQVMNSVLHAQNERKQRVNQRNKAQQIATEGLNNLYVSQKELAQETLGREITEDELKEIIDVFQQLEIGRSTYTQTRYDQLAPSQFTYGPGADRAKASSYTDNPEIAKAADAITNKYNFSDYEETYDSFYKDALAELPFPSQAVRATTKFVGHDEIMSSLKNTMPTTWNFSSGQLMEDGQISGKDLMDAGYAVNDVMMMTSPINGEIGYYVTLKPRTEKTEVNTDYPSEVFLLGDQINTAGLQEVSSKPMNMVHTLIDNIAKVGETEGSIDLAGGYSLEVSNISGRNPVGTAMARILDEHGVAVTFEGVTSEGNVIFGKGHPGSDAYNAALKPLSDRLMEHAISLVNTAGQPVLFYGD